MGSGGRTLLVMKTNAFDRFIKVGRAANDVDFQAQIINRNGAWQTLGETHGVFLRGHDELDLLLNSLGENRNKVLGSEAVVVEKPTGKGDVSAQIAHKFLEAFRHGDAAKRAD